MLYDPDAETKKQEIFDLLLVAGYFRIRIPSLTDFDKIVGGLSWGILCSGFDIDLDLEFSDELVLGQKLKFAERVLKALKSMKCPHPLLPHQIQGLDWGSIYPVIQWLLKFVDETRAERQDTNQMISSEIGERVIGSKKEYFHVPSAQSAKLQSRNKKVKKYQFNDPIRVYSALAEMGDKFAASIYQKMSLERAGEAEGVSKKKGKKEEKKESDFEKSSQGTGNLAMDLKAQLEARKAGKAVLKKPSPVKRKKKDEYEEEEVEAIEIEEVEDFDVQKQLKRSNSINADGFMALISMNREENEELFEQIQEIETKAEEGTGAGSILQKETLMFEEQKDQVTETIEKSTKKLSQYQEIYSEVKEEHQEVREELGDLTEKNEDLASRLEKIEKKIDKRKRQMEEDEMQEIENLISKLSDLKDEKTRIKTMAKKETKVMEKELDKYERGLDKLEKNNEVEEINNKFEERKMIYQKKQEELAKISVEVSLFQRKIQEYPSTIEVGQYYKRYVDLFERVAEETDNQRKLDMIYNRKCDIQRLTSDHINLLKTIKQGVLECKKKKHRESLAGNIKDTIKQTNANLKRSKEAYQNAIKEGDDLKNSLDDNLGYQREYYQLLKQIQYEYEKLNQK
jgi:ABC-type transporter Mla subunit MlaD